MLFDPDAGLTLQEVLQRKWDTVWDAQFKEDLLRLAERWECTWQEAFIKLLADFQERYQDPVQRQKMEAWREAQRYPFGRDPRLGKEAPNAPQ